MDMGIRSVLRRLTGGGPAPELDPARADLVVVVSSFDDAQAASSALAQAVGWRPTEQALLRHHLRIPAPARAPVVEIAAQDGYVPSDPAAAAGSDGADGEHPLIDLVLQRVQVLDALHCSQERSRMAGLAQRHDGSVLGWDALQPPREQGHDAGQG